MAPSATTTTTQYEPLILSRGTRDPKQSALAIGKCYDGAKVGKELVRETFRQRVESVDTDVCFAGDEDAFFVADMGHVYRQHMRWKTNLKRVKPHYGTSAESKLSWTIELTNLKR